MYFRITLVFSGFKPLKFWRGSFDIQQLCRPRQMGIPGWTPFIFPLLLHIYQWPGNEQCEGATWTWQKAFLSEAQTGWKTSPEPWTNYKLGKWLTRHQMRGMQKTQSNGDWKSKMHYSSSLWGSVLVALPLSKWGHQGTAWWTPWMYLHHCEPHWSAQIHSELLLWATTQTPPTG